MASLQERVVGALQLKSQAFEDVEHDRAATVQAGAVVALAAISSGLASLTVGGLLTGVVVGLLGWLLGAAILLFVGTRLLPGKNTEADLGQMLRTLGFAQSPGLFQFLGAISVFGLGAIILLALWVWILVAMVVAVRQALDYEDTQRALITCAVAWGIMLLIRIVGNFVGIGATTVASGAL